MSYIFYRTATFTTEYCTVLRTSSKLTVCHRVQGRSDGGYIGIYTPPNKKSVTVLFRCGTFWNCNDQLKRIPPPSPNQILGYAIDRVIGHRSNGLLKSDGYHGSRLVTRGTHPTLVTHRHGLWPVDLWW